MNDLNHVFHDFGSRCNRIGSHEPGACGNSAECSSFISQQIQLICFFRNRQLAHGNTVKCFYRRIIAFLEDILILGNNFFALFPEAVRNESVERIFRESQYAGAHAQSCDIFHLHAAVLFGQIRNRKCQKDFSGMLFHLRMESAVRNNNAALRHLAFMDINRFLIQCHQAVYPFSDGRNDFCRNAQRNGGMTALDAGCKKSLTEEIVAFLRQYTAQNFPAGFYTLPLLASHFPYKITF